MMFNMLDGLHFCACGPFILLSSSLYQDTRILITSSEVHSLTYKQDLWEEKTLEHLSFTHGPVSSPGVALKTRKALPTGTFPCSILYLHSDLYQLEKKELEAKFQP